MLLPVLRPSLSRPRRWARFSSSWTTIDATADRAGLMIYLDTSIVLAHLLSEDRQPPAAVWDNVLVSSRLIEYETWTRLNRAGLGDA